MAQGEQFGVQDQLATTFIARQIQSQETNADYWRAIAGKIDSFLLTSFPKRTLPPGYAQEDLRQDVLVRLLASLPSMEIIDRARFWHYVKTLANHCAIDAARRIRSKKRGGQAGPHPAAELGDEPLAAAIDERMPTASEHARVAEIEACELECVHRLSRPEAREVYLLRRRDQLSFDEIARSVGREKSVTVRTIYSRAQRDVTACLRAKLDGYAGEALG